MTLNTSTKTVKKYNIIPSFLNSTGLLLFSDPVFNSSFISIIMLSSVCSSRQADSETKLLNDTKVDRWRFSPSSGHIKFMCSRFWGLKTFLFGIPVLFNAKWISVMIWMKVKMDVRTSVSAELELIRDDLKSFSRRTVQSHDHWFTYFWQIQPNLKYFFLFYD